MLLPGPDNPRVRVLPDVFPVAPLRGRGLRPRRQPQDTPTGLQAGLTTIHKISGKKCFKKSVKNAEKVATLTTKSAHLKTYKNAECNKK